MRSARGRASAQTERAMRELTIDYVLDGRRRGYNFTTPTDGIDANTLKALWREAMPRGQGWGEAVFADARSLKVFSIASGEVAVCTMTMTDLRDELGRGGIRRVAIQLMTPEAAERDLRARLYELPSSIVKAAEDKLISRDWQLLVKKHREAQQIKSIFKPQTILTFPYSREGWVFVEACILLLVTRATLLTNLIEISPRVNPFADRILSFTTLALDPRGESRIIGLPLERLAPFEGLPAIDIR
ncbi:MAG: hypothetical protein SNJ59_15395 [Aggregatilineales bacterium]